MKFLPPITDNKNPIFESSPGKLFGASALAVLVLAAALYVILRPRPETKPAVTTPKVVQAANVTAPQISNDVNEHARSASVLIQHALVEVDQALSILHDNPFNLQAARSLDLRLCSARTDLTRVRAQSATVRALVMIQTPKRKENSNDAKHTHA